MTDQNKAALKRIAEIIEAVDNRAMVGDIVTPTLKEMTQYEISEIYELASTRAVSPSEWQVPEGWKLVPIEPTAAMCNAVRDSCLYNGSDTWADACKAMLAAAPPNNHNRKGA